MAWFVLFFLSSLYAADVDRLGHIDWRVREGATRRLEAAGPLALPAIHRATNHSDPEVAARLERVRRHVWQRPVRFAVRAVIYGDPGPPNEAYSLPWASTPSRWLVEKCPAVRRQVADFGRTLPGLEGCMFAFERGPHDNPLAGGLDNIRFAVRGIPGAAKPSYDDETMKQMSAWWKEKKAK